MELYKSFKISLDEFTEYFIFSYKYRIVTRTIIVSVLLTLLLWLTNRAHYQLLAVAITFVVIFVIFFLLRNRPYRKLSKRQYLSSQGKLSEVHMSINEIRVELHSDTRDINVEWSDIIKARELKKCIYLYVRNSFVFILPKRIFTPQEEQNLRTIINTNLDATKNKLKK